MNIDLTKEQYHKLMELVYIGDWVLHRIDTEGTEEFKGYEQIKDKVISLSKELGYDDLVDGYTKKVHSYINRYDNDVFWDELVERLARRDIVVQKGSQVITRLYKNEKLYNEMNGIKENYNHEFSQNGVKNIKISKE